MKSTRGVSPPRRRASRARTARRRRLCLGEAARHLHALEDEIQASATEILAKFPQLVNMRRSRSVADPFVIALARVQGLTVVTGGAHAVSRAKTGFRIYVVASRGSGGRSGPRPRGRSARRGVGGGPGRYRHHRPTAESEPPARTPAPRGQSVHPPVCDARRSPA